jgi:hypothetical protein
MFTARIAEAAFCPSLVEFFYLQKKISKIPKSRQARAGQSNHHDYHP